MLVFPELSLTGYELDLAEELAFSLYDARLAPLVEAAIEGGITLIVGAPVRLDSRLHIGALVITPDGDVDVYTKRHLAAFTPDDNPGGPIPPPEATVFEPGDHDPLVDLGGSSAAVAICADVNQSSHVRTAAERGAATYLAGVFAIPTDRDSERMRGYAEQHSMAVVLANFGGPTGSLPSGGRSAIWAPGGELLVEPSTTGAGVAVAIEGEGRWRPKAIPLSS